MPRDLGDVLHYFLPEVGQEEVGQAEHGQHDAGVGAFSREAESSREGQPAALPVIAVPVGERDVVRAAFVWNLVVEVARLGARATLVAPTEGHATAVWPGPGEGPMGSQVILSGATDATSLYREAVDAAVDRAARADDGGIVFARVPPRWLMRARPPGRLERWCWLLTSTDSRDLLETYALVKRILSHSPGADIGVTVHGVRSIADARDAFDRLAAHVRLHLGARITSYGLLVDDLHVYRAIVAQRPIGLAHPQSPAAKSLADVARMLLDDARERAVV